MKKDNANELLKCIGIFVRLAVALFVFGSAHRAALGIQQNNQPHSTPTNSSASGEGDFRIGPRDMIEIQIDRAPQLSGLFQVGADGTFYMPHLNRIIAQGKTPEELALFIADGLRGHYLKNPIVKVLMKQINSRSFYIQGAVSRPGVYQIEGRATLLKLITIAGGLAENHGSTAYIIREIKPKSPAQYNNEMRSASNQVSPTSYSQPAGADLNTGGKGEYELKTVSISGLLKGGFDQNMPIEPGDMVNIPPGDVFFVAGEVNAPGSFPLKEGTTLRQAISLAQGTTFRAVASRGIIFRENPETSKREEIKIDIGAIMSGKKEDMMIMANDIIIIPNSQFKSIAGVLLKEFGYTTPRILLQTYR